jgi:predicted MFS family arabinose efflux permease
VKLAVLKQLPLKFTPATLSAAAPNRAQLALLSLLALQVLLLLLLPPLGSNTILLLLLHEVCWGLAGSRTDSSGLRD